MNDEQHFEQGQPVREFLGQDGVICGPFPNKAGWWIVRWEDGRVGCAEGKYLQRLAQ